MPEFRTEQREDGRLFAVAGGSRKGKTAWTMQQLKKAPRALVWDPRGEYTAAGCLLFDDLSKLAAALRETWEQPGKFAYWGPIAHFDQWAKLAYLWGQIWPAALVADELADVSVSGAGRGAWGELVRKGMFYGCHIYGLTQRPQEVDKTLWGNATVRHCHALELPLDAEYMARVMGCEISTIQGMQPLEWIERRSGDDAGVIHRGKVSF